MERGSHLVHGGATATANYRSLAHWSKRSRLDRRRGEAVALSPLAGTRVSTARGLVLESALVPASLFVDRQGLCPVGPLSAPLQSAGGLRPPDALVPRARSSSCQYHSADNTWLKPAARRRQGCALPDPEPRSTVAKSHCGLRLRFKPSDPLAGGRWKSAGRAKQTALVSSGGGAGLLAPRPSFPVRHLHADPIE